MKIRAYAKINLALDVVSEREDGYHEFQDCLKRIGFHETYGYNILRESL